MITTAVARRILRGQGMPPREIRALLATDDPLLVRRLLELHRERLEEWFEEQQRLAARIERSLVGEATAHLRTSTDSGADDRRDADVIRGPQTRRSSVLWRLAEPRRAPR